MVPVALASGWVVERAEDVVWERASRRGLSGRQLAELTTCDATSVATMAKVVAQDVSPACGEWAFVQGMVRRVETDVALRDRMISMGVAAGGRARWRVLVMGAKSGAAVDLGAEVWSADERGALVEGVLSHGLDGAFLDPLGAGDVAVRRLADEDADALATRLWGAVAARRSDAEGVAAAQRLLGLPRGALWTAVPLEEVPEAWRGIVARTRVECAAGRCEVQMAALLDVGEPGEGWEPPPEAALGLAATDWVADRYVALAQRRWRDAWSTWVAASPRSGERWERVGGVTLEGGAPWPEAAPFGGATPVAQEAWRLAIGHDAGVSDGDPAAALGRAWLAIDDPVAKRVGARLTGAELSPGPVAALGAAVAGR